jgi:hypothetical protein
VRRCADETLRLDILTLVDDDDSETTARELVKTGQNEPCEELGAVASNDYGGDPLTGLGQLSSWKDARSGSLEN